MSTAAADDDQTSNTHDDQQTDPATADPEPEPAEPTAATDTAGADASQPTTADLLTRLRSTTREPWTDPDSPRRGGLLSVMRLPAGLRVNLDVTIALSTLAGHDDLSARLTGLGVLTADTARALATAAGTIRILLTNDPPHPPHQRQDGSPPESSPTQQQPIAPDGPTAPRPAQPSNHGGIHHHAPDCGTILDFGRTTYRPPATVLDRINTRDQRCRFPGCPQPVTRCDHDHRTPWDDGGATCPCNLDTLCRYHHRVKTFTAWTADRDQHTNTLTWTSPLGRTHTDQPAPDLPTGTPLKLADPPSDNSRAGRARTVHPAVGPRATENAPSGAAFGSAVVFDLGPVDGDPPPF